MEKRLEGEGGLILKAAEYDGYRRETVAGAMFRLLLYRTFRHLDGTIILSSFALFALW